MPRHWSECQIQWQTQMRRLPLGPWALLLWERSLLVFAPEPRGAWGRAGTCSDSLVAVLGGRAALHQSHVSATAVQ